MSKIVIRDIKNGKERTVTFYQWELMKTKEGQGDVRKGYQYVGPFNGKVAPTLGPKGGIQPSFLPAEIEEAQRKRAEADKARERDMIAGTPVKEAPEAPTQAAPAPEPTPAPAVVAEAAKEPPAPAQEPDPAASDAPPPVEKQDFTVISGITAKVEELLNAAGILTYAQLAETGSPALNAILDKSNLAAKKALAPAWRGKAAELAKPPAPGKTAE